MTIAALLFLAAQLHSEPDRIAQEARGHVGAAAVVIGDSGVLFDVHGAEHFPMQSVYKFPIGMAVLHAVDKGSLKLDQSVTVRKAELVPPALHSPLRDLHPEGECQVSLRELLRYAVSESDGTASDVLLHLAGGAAKVQWYLEGLGVTEVKIATTEKEMAADPKAQYRNWATPRGMVSLLRIFHERRALSPASSAYLKQLMTETETGPNRLRGMLPAGTRVAHKTGTSNTVGGMTAATNDVGLVALPGGKTMAIAVFVSDSPADTAAREGVIAKLARHPWDEAVREVRR